MTAARISLAVIVCLLPSLAKSFAQAVRYITNIPHARENALAASLPTFVEDGKVFFSIRRTLARGGSNSVILEDDDALGGEAMFS